MIDVPIYVFGEVLFDHFPGGAQVLGGAPFNVAWHLQAFGNRPRFISRIGTDQPGNAISDAMTNWGMDCSNLQRDSLHPTGRVKISINDGEPSYEIVEGCAYDFISTAELKCPFPPGILYHGSLCLRNSVSAETFAQLGSTAGMRIFLDVNLRSPWWRQRQVESLLQSATWAKMNQHELQQLGKPAKKPLQQMLQLRKKFELEQLILTRGEKGALVCTADGELHHIEPVKPGSLIDTVGAGDAFSAVYLHGLRRGWPIDQILQLAQRFAGSIISLRGATTTEVEFYRQFAVDLDELPKTR